MSTVILGCDTNSSNDSKCQNTVAKVLEKAGHKVEKLSIGPNSFASYSYSGKAKGKIGVFLIASGITAIADLYSGNTNFKYAYFGIRGDLKQPRLSTMNDFKTSPISKDKHGDCTPAICNKLAGKTYPQMNEITKSKCIAVFGTTCQELGDNIVKAMGGESSDDAKKISQGGTIRDALQKLLTFWDGEVECYIRGDEVHINRIRDPEKYTSVTLEEGFNVFSDSVKVTDVNPNTVNYLKVVWAGGSIVFKDDKLIERFGLNKATVLAANVNETKKSSGNSSSSTKSSS